MEIENQLYWILLETELEDPDLYFPPDTPVGKTNPKRHYAILKKRHIRQRERLINLQKCELEEYQKKFSVEYREDLFIKPTITAFEPVKGTDFLAENSDSISELLASIPTLIIENQFQATKPKETEQSNAKRDEFQEIIKKKFGTGFEVINKKHQLQLDALLRLQKDDLTVIPREYHDPPVYAAIKRDHRMSPSSPPQHSPTRKRTAEYEERLYKKTKSSSSRYESSEPRESSKHRSSSTRYESSETRDSSKYRSSHAYKSDREFTSNNIPGADSPNDREVTVPTSQHYTGGRPPLMGTHTRFDSPPTGQPPLMGTHTIFDPPSNGRPPLMGTHTRFDPPSNGRPPMMGTHIRFDSPSTGRPPMYNGSSISTSPAVGAPKQLGVPFGPRSQTVGGKPPTVGSTSSGQPPTVDIASWGRPPPISSASGAKTMTVGSGPGGRPPTVGTSSGGRPPTVGTDAKNGTPSNRQPPSIGSTNNRRDSLPLFNNKPIHHHVVSLLDKGTLLIQNKPNRVIIRGHNGISTNYGDPKDYDDAINSSVERPDNPVYKRHRQGQDFLFYKNLSGKVVTIGPVSKIQPLIHKFFLSM